MYLNLTVDLFFDSHHLFSCHVAKLVDKIIKIMFQFKSVIICWIMNKLSTFPNKDLLASVLLAHF